MIHWELKETPKTPVSGEKKAKKTISPLWKSVLVGGVPGILIGATVPDAADLGDSSDPGVSEPTDVQENATIPVAHSVNDEMSFSEAFAAARSEVGPGGAFVWHGNVYGTYRGDDPEWLEMTAEERMEHSQHVMSQVHRVPYTPSEDEPIIEPNPADADNNEGLDNGEEQVSGEDVEEQDGDEEVPDGEEQVTTETVGGDEEQDGNEDVISGVDQGGTDILEGDGEPIATDIVDDEDNHADEIPAQEVDASGEPVGEVVEEPVEEVTEEPVGEVDVHIVGVGQMETADGNTIQVGYGEVDGHDSIFADTDGDGEVDTVLIDHNDNGLVDDDEVYEVEGDGMTMEELAEEAAINSAETPDDQLYTDMPDYTNDADTSSLD